MAGHVASAAEERCSDCVYEIGQSLTEMVDIWGENSGIGAVSGRVRSGDSTAELSNMPGMTGYTSPVRTDGLCGRTAPVLPLNVTLQKLIRRTRSGVFSGDLIGLSH